MVVGLTGVVGDRVDTEGVAAGLWVDVNEEGAELDLTGVRVDTLDVDSVVDCVVVVEVVVEVVVVVVVTVVGEGVVVVVVVVISEMDVDDD